MLFSRIRRRQGGFSLIELMVVVAVIAIIAAIAVPNFQRAMRDTRRKSAHRAAIKISHAIEMHAATQELPPAPADMNLRTLEPLVDPGTDDARLQLLFRERGFWLFLTGTRLGDLRRLVRDYGLAAEEVYPSGAYVQGGEHGADVVFEIDFDETNNPNYTTANCNVTTVN